MCPANSHLQVQFSTPIAIPSYRAQKVQIDGETFDDNKPDGSRVALAVPERIGRAYSITIGDGLVDVYGQRYVGGAG